MSRVAQRVSCVGFGVKHLSRRDSVNRGSPQVNTGRKLDQRESTGVSGYARVGTKVGGKDETSTGFVSLRIN